MEKKSGFTLNTCQKGFLSIIAILLVVIVSLICVAATYQFVSDSRQAANSLSSSQAFYMAQSGLEYNKHLIRNGTLACGTSVASTTFTGAPGVFTATSSLAGSVCTITVEGYVPSTASPIAKRTLQAGITSTGVSASPVVTAGAVSMLGIATVTNLSVTASSPGYEGSTIDSGGAVSLIGLVSTAVSGLNPSSTAGSLKADVQQNNTALTSANLWGQFFSKTKAQIEAAATPVASEVGIANVNGGTYYSSGPLTLVGNDTIGTQANPTILIVNGNLTFVGNSTVYGLIYVIGGTLSITGNTIINGAAVAENGVSLVGIGSIAFNSIAMINTHNTNANTILHYNDALTSLKEIIP